MANLKNCRICNQGHNSKIKGFLSYPKQIFIDNVDKYFTRLINKINEKSIQDLSFLDTHYSYKIDQDICPSCWQFMFQGFECKKCSSFNYQYKPASKQCCLCKTLYCSKCERELDLFSQNGSCEFCERYSQSICGFSNMLLTFLLAILIPCLAFKYLIIRFLETIDKFQYTKLQKSMAICSFVIAFPMIYVMLVVVFCFFLIGQIIQTILSK